MTELLFSSLLALSLGSLLCLPLISVREIGRGFFTLWVVIVGVLGGAALGLHASGLMEPMTGPRGARVALLLSLSLALLPGFWAALRWGPKRLASGALLLCAVGGALVLREEALIPETMPLGGGSSVQGALLLSRAPDAPQLPSAASAALRVTSLLVSALAVGMVTVAMVLGHWYLVQPKLALAPLRRLCDLLVGVLVARLAVSGWGLASSLWAGHRLLGTGEPIPWEVLILSQRLLFGFVGSLVLAVMIRKTVALRSTMSATGLLYIAILFVWVGEFLSIYLGQITEGGLVV